MINLSRNSTEVFNYFTSEKYHLTPLCNIECTDSLLSEISSICNESKIYTVLFHELCGGLPYTGKHARGWVEWAHSGWNNNTHFCFGIFSNSGKLVAACDIKNNNIEESEIGYWSSISHPGIITNSVIVLGKLARIAGYKSLMGRTVHQNKASTRVLLRSNFVPELSRRDEKYDYFTLTFQQRANQAIKQMGEPTNVE